MVQYLFSDRRRTNMMKQAERRSVLFLCQHMPVWVTPNGLTTIGLVGGFIVFAGLWLARSNALFLLLSILGLALHWFGDSLDGRLAYYRNTPRKWFGFSLDVIVDWVSVFAMGLGCYTYLPHYRAVAFLLVAAYGAAIVIALLRYKISGTYKIDLFTFGPTEMRLLIAAVLVLEIFRRGSLLQFCIIATVVLAVMDILELRNVLRLADARDASEKPI
jgi:hypothetical protein